MTPMSLTQPSPMYTQLLSFNLSLQDSLTLTRNRRTTNSLQSSLKTTSLTQVAKSST